MADPKRIAALGMKILNILKGMGMSPRFGLMTKVSRNPEFRNLYNADLTAPKMHRKGLGNIEDPEQLKKLVRMDSDFLPQIKNEEELETFLNNLEYLKSTYPDVFSKPEVVTEAKTGIKTLVDDVNEQLKGKKSMETVNPKTGEITSPKEPVTTAENIKRKPTKEEYDEYSKILDDDENFVVQGNETFEQLDALVKKQKDYEDYMFMQYKRGKLDPVAGEGTRDRMNFLRKKAEEAELSGDTRLFTLNEMKELEDLERTFSPMGVTKDKINISDPKVAESFTEFAKRNDPEGFKKIQKLVDDINNKNILENFDVKDRKPNAKGGFIKGVSYKSMFNDLDRTLKKGLGTMFKRKR